MIVVDMASVTPHRRVALSYKISRKLRLLRRRFPQFADASNASDLRVCTKNLWVVGPALSADRRVEPDERCRRQRAARPHRRDELHQWREWRDPPASPRAGHRRARTLLWEACIRPDTPRRPHEPGAMHARTTARRPEAAAGPQAQTAPASPRPRTQPPPRVRPSLTDAVGSCTPRRAVRHPGSPCLPLTAEQDPPKASAPSRPSNPGGSRRPNSSRWRLRRRSRQEVATRRPQPCGLATSSRLRRRDRQTPAAAAAEPRPHAAGSRSGLQGRASGRNAAAVSRR
jgi:hypothetical protein